MLACLFPTDRLWLKPASVCSHQKKAQAGLERLSSKRRDCHACLLILAALMFILVPAASRKANGEGLFYDQLPFWGMGVSSGDFLWEREGRAGHKAFSSPPGGFFCRRRCTEPGRVKALPPPLILAAVADLTYPQWVTGIKVVLLLDETLRAHSFLPSRPALQLLAEFPVKEKGLPGPGTGFPKPQPAESEQKSFKGGALCW